MWQAVSRYMRQIESNRCTMGAASGVGGQFAGGQADPINVIYIDRRPIGRTISLVSPLTGPQNA